MRSNTISDRMQAIRKWCAQDERVKALLLVGSYARGEERADSDIDLMIITEDKHNLLNLDWIEAYGKPQKCVQEEYGACTSIRVFYEDKTEMEYGLVDLTWLSRPLDKGTRKVLENGYMVLYGSCGIDRENIEELLAG